MSRVELRRFRNAFRIREKMGLAKYILQQTTEYISSLNHHAYFPLDISHSGDTSHNTRARTNELSHCLSHDDEASLCDHRHTDNISGRWGKSDMPPPPWYSKSGTHRIHSLYLRGYSGALVTPLRQQQDGPHYTGGLQHAMYSGRVPITNNSTRPPTVSHLGINVSPTSPAFSLHVCPPPPCKVPMDMGPNHWGPDSAAADSTQQISGLDPE